MNAQKIADRIATEVIEGGSREYKFHSKGDLHRNVLLNTLEDEYGITFRDYDLSTVGITSKNSKTEKILKKLFSAHKASREAGAFSIDSNAYKLLYWSRGYLKDASKALSLMQKYMKDIDSGKEDDRLDFVASTVKYQADKFNDAVGVAMKYVRAVKQYLPDE